MKSFRAYLPQKNIDRGYQIWWFQIGNTYEIWTRFGRYQTTGKTKKYVAYSEEEKDKIIKKLEHKRLTAKNRIGCNYVLLKPKQLNLFC